MNAVIILLLMTNVGPSPAITTEKILYIYSTNESCDRAKDRFSKTLDDFQHLECRPYLVRP